MLGTSKSAGSYYRRNAQAAHDTWARPFPLVFSVQADSPNSRFAHRACNLQWIDTGINASHVSYTSTKPQSSPSSSSSSSTFEDNQEPWPRDPLLGRMLVGRCHRETGVLLVPACDDSYYGDRGPCCKLDAALVFATAPEAEYNWFGGKPLKHMMFMDDDNYLRLDAFLPWLKFLGEAAAEPLACVNIAVPSPTHVKKMETCNDCGGVWAGEDNKYRANKCKEVAPGMSAMTQQLVFNAVALRRVRDAAARGGNRAICSNGKGKLPLGFSVTHDVGFGVFAWQHALQLCSIPGVQAAAEWSKVLKIPTDEVMILHGAKERGRTVGCDQERFGGQVFDNNNNFAGSIRVESPERVAALWQPSGDDDTVNGAHGGRGAWATAAACRGINHNISTDWFSQYDAHSHFKNKSTVDIQNAYLVQGKLPLRMPLFGYNRTDHFKRQQALRGTWAPFMPSDCA